jgi:protein O-GlcNAc transferase
MDAISDVNQAIGEWRAGRIEAARRLALSIDASSAPAVVLAPLTELLRQLGALAAAEAVGRLAVARETSAAAWNNLGLVLQHTQGEDAARAAFAQALRQDPEYARARYNLARLLLQGGALEAAESQLQRVLARHPAYHAARVALALVYRHRAQDEQAAACLRTVLARDPGHRGARVQWASLRARQRAGWVEAEALLQQVLSEQPRDAQAWHALGQLRERQRRPAEALAAYDAGLAVQPAHAGLLADRENTRRELCAWPDWPHAIARLRRASRQALAAGRPALLTPMNSCRFPVPPALQRAIAERHAQGIAEACARLLRPARVPPPAPPPLRVGWLSHEFQYNVVGRLLATLLPAFDRSRIQVIGLAYNADTGEPFGQRLAGECDEFIDLSALTNVEAAARVAAARLHLLIDVNPYLEGGRPGIAALRPAPLQVSYLSPITSGAPWIDYFLTDPVASPSGAAAHFSEALAYLPPSYLPSPEAAAIAPTPPSRAQLGLPDGARVLGSFNRQDKILPATFHLWLDLLRRYPDTVLWLSANPVEARTHLRASAEAQGIDPARLIFAEHEADMGRHLARLQHIDLFLDTFPHTAHVTAMDVLWAGAPLLTRAGASFASRVSASLLSALGLPELITHSAAEYAQQARVLLDQPQTLAALRARLRHQRDNAEIFRPEVLADRLSTLWQAMWERCAEGLPPTSLDYRDLPLAGAAGGQHSS